MLWLKKFKIQNSIENVFNPKKIIQNVTCECDSAGTKKQTDMNLGDGAAYPLYPKCLSWVHLETDAAFPLSHAPHLRQRHRLDDFKGPQHPEKPYLQWNLRWRKVPISSLLKYDSFIQCKNVKGSFGFDSYTIPSQQLHNNFSHESGLECVESTFM